MIMQEQATSTTNQQGTDLLRNRFMYRNATELGRGWRFSFVGTGENVNVLRPTLAYAPPSEGAGPAGDDVVACRTVGQGLSGVDSP